MGRVNEGTPHSFVMKCIKVKIESKLSNQIYTHFSFVVSKWAVLPIVAETSGGEIALAKFSLVFIWMVKFFDPRVTVDAWLTLWALFLLRDETTELWSVLSWWPSTILRLVMVICTLLQVVVRVVTFATFGCFEGVEVKIENKFWWWGSWRANFLILLCYYGWW